MLSRGRIADYFLKSLVAGKYGGTVLPGLDGIIGLAGLLILLAQQDVDLRESVAVARQAFAHQLGVIESFSTHSSGYHHITA
jgi:hypothetical protein